MFECEFGDTARVKNMGEYGLGDAFTNRSPPGHCGTTQHCSGCFPGATFEHNGLPVYKTYSHAVIITDRHTGSPTHICIDFDNRVTERCAH